MMRCKTPDTENRRRVSKCISESVRGDTEPWLVRETPNAPVVGRRRTTREDVMVVAKMCVQGQPEKNKT